MPLIKKNKEVYIFELLKNCIVTDRIFNKLKLTKNEINKINLGNYFYY